MNLKLALKTLLLIFAISFLISSNCYSQASVMPVFDDVVRTSQLYGKRDSLLSFCIRPNYSLTSNDSLFKNILQRNRDTNKIPKALRNFSLLPAILQQQYNTHHAYGWNDGSMIPAKGY